MSVLEDKFGELTQSDSVSGFVIVNEEEQFTVKINLKGKDFQPAFHQIDVGPYSNLHRAVDEAIKVLREHLSDCTIC